MKKKVINKEDTIGDRKYIYRVDTINDKIVYEEHTIMGKKYIYRIDTINGKNVENIKREYYWKYIKYLRKYDFIRNIEN